MFWLPAVVAQGNPDFLVEKLFKSKEFWHLLWELRAEPQLPLPALPGAWPGAPALTCSPFASGAPSQPGVNAALAPWWHPA